jgi:subtilisin-like proprotein convertase family protein
MSSTSRFLLAAATTALAVSTQATAQSLGCSTGGAGGFIPTTGTGGGGIYPTTFPPSELQSTLAVASIPVGATEITGVVLHGLTHTYTGDIQIVLEDPAGTKYNLFTRVLGACDWSGADYTIVSPGEAPAPACPGGVAMTQTVFAQAFGGWVSGTQSVNNTAINTVPMATGTWKIYFYDWAGADTGSLTSWDLCFGLPPPPPPPPPASVCAAPIGSGGPIPTAGTGDGTWPNIMPSAPLIVPLAVTVPAGSTQIVRVKLNGISHTWVGDLQVTLKDPSGIEHNIVHRPGSTGGGLGFDCDISGDYSIYETYGNDLAASCGADNYFQTFGAWPGGTNGIMNTALSAIPAINGNYTLTIYDWAGGDTGSLTSWELCFNGASGPVAYCTAGTSTNGCVPAISATAQPSATLAHPCSITIANLEGQKFGIVFYGINNTGFTPTPWAAGSNSFLCVKGPTQRTGTQNSGGTINACDGALTRDWNAYQTANPSSVGNPFSAGDDVYVQGWYRDPPAAKTTNLSNALHLTMTP